MAMTVTSKELESASREERIRCRAEELYLQRAGGPGSALEDWLTAEKEVLLEEQRLSDENK